MYETKKGYGEGLLDVKVFLESLMGMSKEPWPKGAFYKNDKYLTWLTHSSLEMKVLVDWKKEFL